MASATAAVTASGQRRPVEATAITTLNKGPTTGQEREAVSVSVVIPTLNEAQNLPHVLPAIPDWVHEVVLVDGGSSDGTVEAAKRLREDIIVVEEPTPGKGAALRRGFAIAEGEIIVMLDADGSMDPAEIPAFVSVLIGGADYAKGSRFCHGGGTEDMEWYRKFGNWALTKAVRNAFGGRYSDLCYGYNAFWASTIDRLDLDADGFEIETLMNIRALTSGMTVTEVPSYESQRIYGSSHLNTVTDGWRVLKTIVSERRSPFRADASVIDLRDRRSEISPNV